MPYRLQAAFWVGVIGTVAALGILYSFAFAFVIVGWIPLGGGWFAGRAVSKLPDAPTGEVS